jgi:hypothetical protein
MQCQARILEEGTVYTIGETDFVATRQCSVATTTSVLLEKARIPICKDCSQKRKKGGGDSAKGWQGWFDDTIAADTTYMYSPRFYEAVLGAYTEEFPQSNQVSPKTLRDWFHANLAAAERGELEEELEGLKVQLGDGNKPETMQFSEFIGLVKRKTEILNRLGLGFRI